MSKQEQLHRRLLRCEQKLYRLASTATIITVGTVSIQAQMYSEKIGSENLFEGIDVGLNATPQLVDVDGDGDFDLISGAGGTLSSSGKILYYQNDGNNNFNEQTGTDNPFTGIDVGGASKPHLVDFDEDGDLDLVCGDFDGFIHYFQNDGNNNFNEQTGSDNPFNGIDVGYTASPQLVDADEDGDLDLISGVGIFGGYGSLDGTIQYYRNDGSNNFIEQIGVNNPFDGIDVGGSSSPQLIDVDSDGDLDLISGRYLGTIEYYKNDGNNSFTQQNGLSNPFDNIDVGYMSSPQLVDIDEDGDLDLICGVGGYGIDISGTIKCYENLSIFSSTLDGYLNCVNNPFNGIDVGDRSTPQLVDVDDDGNLDLISGNYLGKILYYQNDGSNNFIQQIGVNNPFDNIDVGFGYASNPQLVDFDSDGDLDLISGERAGFINYYQNDGQNNFTQQIGSSNPFDGIDIGSFSSPQLIDFDDDNDLDLIAGGQVLHVLFYQNDGQNNFIRQTGMNNPFNGINLGPRAKPQLVDEDEDGDLDLISGTDSGKILYYKNDGSDNFIQQEDIGNIDVGFESSPQLVDFDGDGDLDLISGEKNGHILYYKNTDLSVNASTENCINNEGEVELSISSSEEEGPYTITGGFSGSIGTAGVLGAMATLVTEVNQPGSFTFEVTTSDGCLELEVVVNINNLCATNDISNNSIYDDMTYTGIQTTEICNIDTIHSIASVGTQVELTYSANEIVILQNGFEALNGCTFVARIGNCLNSLVDESIDQRPEKMAEVELMAYPNPTSDQLHLVLTNSERIRKVQIFDVFGKLIRVEKNTERGLSLNDLTPGIYFLLIESEYQTYQKSIVKQ